MTQHVVTIVGAGREALDRLVADAGGLTQIYPAGSSTVVDELPYGRCVGFQITAVFEDEG